MQEEAFVISRKTAIIDGTVSRGPTSWPLEWEGVVVEGSSIILA